ncbi:hypothetical protein SAMN05216334_10951 [Nitrosomonas ureae]|uniref:Uncharacterized protein n=1 Tax=Nitrosomonas ureae TaxID=44577 RepID=A0A1H5UTK6_9PROT|nr:hypothetical protein SAMN05216334_10951 [Nitrosomonas ureae]
MGIEQAWLDCRHIRTVYSSLALQNLCSKLQINIVSYKFTFKRANKSNKWCLFIRLSYYDVIKASVPKGLNLIDSISVRFITQVFTIDVVYFVRSVVSGVSTFCSLHEMKI